MRSPYYDEFLPHENQEIDMITNPIHNNPSAGWLLSSPSTWTFSKMKLDDSPTKSPYSHRRTKETTHLNTMAFASSIELQRQLSLSRDSRPESTEDQIDTFSSWTGSDTSLVERACPSTIRSPEIPHYENFLDSWFGPKNESETNLSEETLPIRDSNLSTWNRNFASTNLSALDMSKSPTFLQRPEPKSKSRPRTPHSKPQTQRSYLAFPPMTPQHNYSQDPPARQHKSWPAEPQAERPPLRARATTTPSNIQTNRPSNLSTCTTLDNKSPGSVSSTSTYLYMRSPPSSPIQPPELMEFMSQQSYFFHDDDDDAKEKSWFETQREKWLRQTRFRDPSTLPKMDEPPRLTPSQAYYQTDEARKGKKKKKSSLGSGFKDLFGMRKSPKAKEKERKPCPKCRWVLQQGEKGLFVTCWCRADLCFGCLADWDMCEGACGSS